MAPRLIPWRPMPPELRWASEDRRFGVALRADALDLMLGLCRLAGADETGGILIGRYNDNHDTAVVTRVTGAPPRFERDRARVPARHPRPPAPARPPLAREARVLPRGVALPPARGGHAKRH